MSRETARSGSRAPLEEPDPAKWRSVARLVRAHAARTPDKPALVSIDQGVELSWRDLHLWCNRLAGLLAAKGIGRGDRIAVLGENTLELAILYCAVLYAGATFCVVNTEINASHLREMLARLEPKLVLWHGELDPAALGEGAPGERMRFGDPQGDGALFSAAARYPDAPDPPDRVRPDDHAVISFTSGTADKPKGVIHDHGNYFWIAEQTIDMWGITAADRLLEYRSLSWASSHMLSLMPCLATGATLLLARRFSASRFFDWIATHEPSIAIGVPTVVNLLLERPEDAPAGAFAALRFMTCSTAPLMVDSHERFERRFGVRLIQLYGMSEGGVVAGNHHDDRRIGSVGRPGLYQNLRIVGADGEPCPPGAVGEIEIGGAQTAYGYLLPDRSVDVIRGRRLKTGDLGFLDGDGFLHVTGRAKDVIIRGGVNIAPLEIDGVLAAHPAVAEAATIGVPDRIYGEEVVAYVAPRPGAHPTEAALAAHCAAALPEFKRPRRIVVAAAIPKTDRGKIDRAALKVDWRRRNGGS
jgi:acyl-CoA synthetase (AMP-forming)/AMP-acid ligase II